MYHIWVLRLILRKALTVPVPRVFIIITSKREPVVTNRGDPVLCADNTAPDLRMGILGTHGGQGRYAHEILIPGNTPTPLWAYRRDDLRRRLFVYLVLFILLILFFPHLYPFLLFSEVFLAVFSQRLLLIAEDMDIPVVKRGIPAPEQVSVPGGINMDREIWVAPSTEPPFDIFLAQYSASRPPQVPVFSRSAQEITHLMQFL